MIPPAWRALPLILAVLLVTSTACGSTAEPAAKSTPSSSKPRATPTDAWVEIVDEPTGARFRLPKRVAPQERLQAGPGGTPVSGRTYQVEVNKNLSVAFTVIELGQPVPTNYPRAVADGIAAALRHQGADDASISRVSKPEVAKGSAFDFTLTFTASTGDLSYWRNRNIAVGDVYLAAQVISFRAPGNTTVARQVDRYFDQVIASIVAP